MVQSLTYDADGNLTNDKDWTYTYDAENRLVGMQSALLANFGFTRLNLTFIYDYLGRRVEKKVTNVDTGLVTFDHRYIYVGWKLAAETDTSGHMTRSYTWGQGGSGTSGSFLELTNYSYDGSWNLLSTTDYFASNDGNGNVASLVRNDGVTVVVYEYSPFGESLRIETTTTDTSVSDNPG